MAVCTGRISAGEPTGTQDSAIPDILASISESVDLDGMVLIEKYLRIINEDE